MSLRCVSTLLLLIAWSGIHSSAQSPATATASKKHFLWQVPGTSNTVFLLGSLHLMKKDMYPLAAEIETAYKRAGVVAFETDISALESPEFAMKLMAEATYPEGESLKKNLPAATYSLLASNLQAALGSADAFDKFKPWMAAVTLVAIELQKLGFQAEKGVDKHFYARAKADKKSLATMETPDDQLKLLTSLNDLEAGDFLGQSLREMHTWKTMFTQLAEAWQAGDTATLEKLLTESFKEYPTLEKRFMTDRNQKWLGKIEGLLKADKDVLIVVGAGHLIGKDSVVDLLSRKGYKPKQL